MIKTAIIGYGKMGRIRHQAIEKYAGAEVVALYDVEAETGNTLFRPDVDSIISDYNIDAVFICTPNYLNKELTMRALEAGKHVFCEKPPAFTEADVIEIRKVEDKKDQILAYGFNHRHHGSIKKIKALIDSNEFGEILWIRGRYGKSVDKSFFDNWRSRRELAGGGILIDQGIHMLDLMLHVAGDFDEVQAMVSDLYWHLEVEDNVFANLRNSNTGVVASLHSTMTQWRHLFSLEIFLKRGYMVLNGLKTSSNTYGKEVLSIAKNRSTAPAATWEDEEHITYHEDTFWYSEIEAFYQAILTGERVINGNSEDAQKLMKIIDKIYANGRTYNE